MNRILFLTAVTLFFYNTSRANFQNSTSHDEGLFRNSPNPTGTIGKTSKFSFSESNLSLKEQDKSRYREKLFPSAMPPVPSIPLGDVVYGIWFLITSGVVGFKLLNKKMK